MWFGWLDDVLFEQNFRGMLTGEAIPEALEYHRWISSLYVGLYDLFPAVPWYGILFTLYILGATMGIFHFLQGRLKSVGIEPLWSAIILVGFYFFMWMENVYLLTFTRISLLMMTAGILSLFETWVLSDDKKKHSNLLPTLGAGFLFLIGLFTRYKLVIFPFSICLSLSLGLYLLNRVSLSALLRFNLPFLGIILLFFTLDQTLQSPDRKANDQNWSTIWSTLDGANVNEDMRAWIEKSPENSIRYRAAMNWFYQDEEKMGIDFIREIGTESAFSPGHLTNWKQKLSQTYQKSRFSFTPAYLEPLNWFWKGVAIFCFNILGLAILIYLWRGGFIQGNVVWGNALIHGVFWLGILMVTLLLKMEDRVFTPFGIGYSLCNLAYLLAVPRLIEFLRHHKEKAYVLAGILGMVVMLRLPGYWQVSVDVRTNLAQKRSMIEDLNAHFKEKIVFTDYYGRFLLHDSPFQNVELADNNQYAVMWGQRGSFEFASHRQFLNELFPSETFLQFMEEVMDRKGVIFLLPDFTAEILEEYLQVLYGKEFYFRRIHSESPLNDIRYSFVWFRMRFSYFEMTQVQPPAEARPAP